MIRNALLAALLVVSLVAGLPVAAGQSAPLTIDADHALTADAKQSQFVEDGAASTDLEVPDMTVTVASEHATCDVSGFHSDLRNDYLCIEYREAVDRRIRIYIPDEYWAPYLRESVDPVKGAATASFEPVGGANYTAVTFRVTEPTTVVWPVTKESALFASARDRTFDRVENVTGVGMPDTQQWQYIPPERLAGNASAYVVKAPNGTDQLQLEYTTDDGEWAPVPEGEQRYAPVYYQTKQGVDDRVYVFSTTTDPPRIRYKTKAAPTSEIAAAFREIGQIPNRIEDIFGVDLPFVGGDD